MSVHSLGHGFNSQIVLLRTLNCNFSILQIPEALKHVRKALHIRNDHANSLHLLALLLSAQKQNEEALQLIEAAVAEYPDNFK